VVFDSRVPVGEGDTRAAYLAGTAAEVPSDQLDQAGAVFEAFAVRGARGLTPADLRPPGPYRLHRAMVTEHSVIGPRPPATSCVTYGLAYDHRTVVNVP
jgi:hypothetical protein